MRDRRPPPPYIKINGPVAELVDAIDLGSIVERRGGSSPLWPIMERASSGELPHLGKVMVLNGIRFETEALRRN